MARRPKGDQEVTVTVNGKTLKPGQYKDGIMYRGKLKDGTDVWRVETYRDYEIVEDENGVEHKRTRTDKHTVHGSFRTAKKLKSSLETKRAEGTYTPPTKVLLVEFLTRWLESTRRREVTRRTAENDKGQATKHIIPALGNIPLQKLTTRDIDDYYQLAITPKNETTAAGRFAGQRGLGLSPATITKHHNMLRKSLAKAKAEGLIPYSPVIEATPPRVPKSKHTILSQAQLDRLLDIARTYRNNRGEATFERWYPFLYTLAYTGMRLGEVLGLKWSQVDLDGGMIYVTETFIEREDDEIDWGQGKSDAAQRPVDIDDDVVKVLRLHRKAQEWLKRLEGERYTDMGLVFTTETGHPPNPSNLRNRVLSRLVKRTNDIIEQQNRNNNGNDAIIPRVTPHDFRHTHATFLLKAGVHPKIVQERLGHRSIQTTMDLYSHVMPSMQRDALERYAAKRRNTHKRQDSETG